MGYSYIFVMSVTILKDVLTDNVIIIFFYLLPLQINYIYINNVLDGIKDVYTVKSRFYFKSYNLTMKLYLDVFIVRH